MQINGEVWFLLKETATNTRKLSIASKKDSEVESSNRKDLEKRLQHAGGKVTSQKKS